MDKSSGELVTLTPNNNNTVQPVALMRLGVFVPTLKSLKNSKKNTLSRTDATEVFLWPVQKDSIRLRSPAPGWIWITISRPGWGSFIPLPAIT